MGILNVNKIQPVGSGQTVTISASDINLEASSITANTFNASSGIVVGVGSTSLPSISPSGDSNTGIFFPEPDTVAIGEGGTEVLRVNSSANVGINSTSPQTKLDVVGGINGTLVLGTAQATTSGTSINFTGIPSWVKRITVMLNGVSTNGTSVPLIQLGSTSFTTSGYLGAATNMGSAVNSTASSAFTTGIPIVQGINGNSVIRGLVTIVGLGSNVWVATSVQAYSDAAVNSLSASNVTLSGTLDRIRITTVNGTDTFDAGTINIMYEG